MKIDNSVKAPVEDSTESLVICPEDTCKKCSTHRREKIGSDYRMAAWAVLLLTCLGIVLVCWNIVLWREVNGLHTKIASLTDKMEQKGKITRSMYRRLRKRVDKLTDPTEFLEPVIEDDGEKTGGLASRISLLKREKRSPVTGEELSDNSSPMSAIRVTRSSRRRSRPQRPSRPCKKSGKRCKKPAATCNCPPRVVEKLAPQNATAFHVNINRENPRVDGGIIRSWNKYAMLNTGFDNTRLNDDGRIAITKPGIYFVYGQVSFQNTPSHNPRFAKLVILSDNAKEFSSCIVQLSSRYSTCNAFAVAKLEAGNSLRVEVERDSVLYTSKPTTYFGAFWIGE